MRELTIFLVVTVSKGNYHRVLVTVFICTSAWWPLLNIIKATRGPYVLGLLKFVFYLVNFGMLLGWYSLRAMALGADPELRALVKLSLFILVVFIIMEIPIILSQL